MPRPYLPFVDWLKAVGLALIVFDHVAHFMLPWRTPPIHPKQLGVVLFVFVTGWTLARERRPATHVVVGRWLPIWTWGLMFALLMSVVGAGWLGDSNPSDYLPLAGGLNVLQDAFPANPTTWYIGTYLHLLVLWAVLLKGRRITATVLLAALILEIVARAMIASAAGLYVAYQSFFNWMSVLLIGLRFGTEQRQPDGRAVSVALLLVVAWSLGTSAIAWGSQFPFMLPSAVSGITGPLLMSVAVSAGYNMHALIAFHAFGQLPEVRAVRFIARNTPLVFIGHMPVYYAIEAWLSGVISPVPLALTEFAICFVGLALVSEVVRPRLQPAIDAARTRVLALLPA
jgi:hypothetical protein